MRSTRTTGQSLCLLGILGFSPCIPACGQTPEEWAGVQAILDDMQRDLGLPGYTFIVARHGQVLYESSFGTIGPDTRIPIASATKWVSGATIMALTDTNVISLDDTTGQWLGWTGDKAGLTIRQLFSHTSGLPPGTPDCVTEIFSTLSECVAEIEVSPLVAAPGTEIHYGGSSMQVAGRMCEVATGMLWIDSFDALIASPLGWTQTKYTSGTNPHIAGGMRATAREYARMLQMLLDGGQYNGGTVLTPGAVDALLADQTNGASVGSIPPTAESLYMGYGIGNWVFGVDGDGATVASSSPGAFGFTPVIDRERDLYVVLAVLNVNVQVNPYTMLLRDEVNRVIDAGDLDCDQHVSATDADLFVEELVAPETSAACEANRADMNGDGAKDGDDLRAFVARLIGG